MNQRVAPSFATEARRRRLLAALASMPLGAAAGSAEGAGSPATTTSKTLVACFSRSGNTRVVAGLLQRALAADVFEIQPAKPYPEEYLATVEEARQERDGGRERALRTVVPGMAGYDTVYLGFPIWGETTPPVVRAFLNAHDLAGKTLVPFITHGGYGLGNSQAVIVRLAPRARLQSAFVMEADQERRTMNQVDEWLRQRSDARRER